MPQTKEKWQYIVSQLKFPADDGPHHSPMIGWGKEAATSSELTSRCTIVAKRAFIGTLPLRFGDTPDGNRQASEANRRWIASSKTSAVDPRLCLVR